MKDFSLTPAAYGAVNMGLEWGDSLFNNVYLSLKIRRGTLISQPDFGSRLHEIKKITPDTISLARDYCKSALQWMLDIGRASSVTVDVERDSSEAGRLLCRVSVYKPDGTAAGFDVFVAVG